MPSTLAKGVALLAALFPAAQGQLFTVNCAPLTIQRGDPIVNPGQISAHVHAVVGGTNFQQTLSNDLARSARATTCDKSLDKSNYWQPQLYHQRRDGQFEIVQFEGAAAYYIARVCDYAPGRQNCNGAAIPRAPPANLRMVVGNPFRRNFDGNNKEHRAISHACLNPGSETPELPKACSRMRAQTFFPSCWNGRDMDTPDHKSHMAFPAIGDYNTGVCPESHPIAIVSVFYEFFYNTGAIQNFNRWVWAQGDVSGYGLHGDYLQGWSDQNRLENAIRTCTGSGGVNAAGCSLNVGPNGPGNSSPQPLQVPAPTEEVGLKGPLARLPGNNPISRRSAKMRY